jgi:hypothetical protein
MPGVSDAVELAAGVQAAGVLRPMGRRGAEFWLGGPLCA